MVTWEWAGETELIGKTQKLMLTNGTQTFGTYLHIKPEKALKKKKFQGAAARVSAAAV